MQEEGPYLPPLGAAFPSPPRSLVPTPLPQSELALTATAGSRCGPAWPPWGAFHRTGPWPCHRLPSRGHGRPLGFLGGRGVRGPGTAPRADAGPVCPAAFLYCFPAISLLGLFPQADTFCAYLLEQIDMLLFGGTGESPPPVTG